MEDLPNPIRKAQVWRVLIVEHYGPATLERSILVVLARRAAQILHGLGLEMGTGAKGLRPGALGLARPTEGRVDASDGASAQKTARDDGASEQKTARDGSRKGIMLT